MKEPPVKRYGHHVIFITEYSLEPVNASQVRTRVLNCFADRTPSFRLIGVVEGTEASLLSWPTSPDGRQQAGLLGELVHLPVLGYQSQR
jgi:hypothetical protein